MPVAQPSLFAAGPVGITPSSRTERIELAGGAWVDLTRDWLGGADEVCARLAGTVAWRQRRRRMYDRVLDEPRLTRWYRRRDDLPDPALTTFRAAMTERYRRSAGPAVEFGALGLNHYRDGADSVAWHADRELRHLDDTLVAILTLGAARPFLLRPTGGGRSIDLHPASGDLLVMGGRAQACWEHTVPKTTRAVGPRISASIRWAAPPR
jgi:alkylated DNA repair dioxygenase AlkB